MKNILWRLKYFVLQHKNIIAIQKRGSKDIWENLYEFPLIETPKTIKDISKIPAVEFKKIIFAKKFVLKSTSKVYKHILSHQIIYAKFWHIEIAKSAPKSVSLNKLKNLAVPRLIDRFLRDEEIL